MAQIVKRDAEDAGIYCQCIRCCEIRNETFDTHEIIYTTSQFRASGAEEYFISATVPRPNRNLLLGFIRLRLCVSHDISPDSARYHPHPMEELRGKTAMIRELHVYGSVRQVSQDAHTAGGNSAQHLGIGKYLLQKAETIACANKYTKMAIISGIGVRDYYRKRGYELQGTYMVKDIRPALFPLPTPVQSIPITFLALLYMGLLLFAFLNRLSSPSHSPDVLRLHGEGVSHLPTNLVKFLNGQPISQ
jgi:elongator complex protein 3